MLVLSLLLIGIGKGMVPNSGQWNKMKILGKDVLIPEKKLWYNKVSLLRALPFLHRMAGASTARQISNTKMLILHFFTLNYNKEIITSMMPLTCQNNLQQPTNDIRSFSFFPSLWCCDLNVRQIYVLLYSLS